VADTTPSMEHLALLVRRAIEHGDVESFAELMDPAVRWGPPGDPSPPCQNRDQVLSWYRRGQDRGVTASVNSVTVLGDHLVVELVVRGSETARDRGGAGLRWQVLTVARGRVTHIVGFDDRVETLAHAGHADAPHV
jgi:hypothetical protein